MRYHEPMSATQAIRYLKRHWKPGYYKVRYKGGTLEAQREPGGAWGQLMSRAAMDRELNYLMGLDSDRPL